MELTHIEDKFVDIGGKFFTSGFDIREKLQGIKAVLFDWDGVFNNGSKGVDGSSVFNEIDALGVDMLRFGFRSAYGKLLKTAIITGEQNPACIHWAKREHFNSVYSQSQNKLNALYHFCDQNSCTPSEVIYIFDDILDIPVATHAGLRFTIKRKCNPMVLEYMERHKLMDYLTGCSGSEHAVREICELLLYLMDKQFEVIEHRSAFNDCYQQYVQEKNKINTHLYSHKVGEIFSSQTA